MRTPGCSSLATLDVDDEPQKVIRVDDSPEIEYAENKRVHLFMLIEWEPSTLREPTKWIRMNLSLVTF